MDAPLNFSNSNLDLLVPLSSADHFSTSNLTELDAEAIAYVLNIIDDKKKINEFTINLINTADWKNSIVSFIEVKNKERATLTEYGIIEIVKMLVSLKPFEIISNIEYSEIKNQEGLVEIAQMSANVHTAKFLSSVEYFGIKNQTKITEIYKSCIKKNATLLIESLPKLKIHSENELLDILFLASDLRPDLVLKSLSYHKVDDRKAVNNLILKCLNQVPYFALTSNEIKTWINLNQPLLEAATSPSLKKIMKAALISPSKEMQIIFNLFEEFAKKPQLELVTRKLWLKFYANKMKGISNADVIAELNNPNSRDRLSLFTRCGMTNDALISAIFGVSGLRSATKIWDHNLINVTRLKRIWKLIKDNELQLLIKSSSNFFAYSISSEKIDHSFLIIQHINEKQEIKYRILQSWLDKHDLDTYMKNRNFDMSSEHFDEFKNELTNILISDEISYKREIFYEQYFMNKIEHISYIKNRHLKFEWGSSNLERILRQQILFETFKKNYLITNINNPL